MGTRMTEFNPRCSVLVIIDDLDIRRAGTRPLEADAVLIVDSNAVLSPTISTQRLQPIAWRNPQLIQSRNRIQLVQLPPSDTPHNFRTNLLRSFGVHAIEDVFSPRIVKRDDHAVTLPLASRLINRRIH